MAIVTELVAELRFAGCSVWAASGMTAVKEVSIEYAATSGNHVP
jgi:hypothetical protein